MDEGLGCLWQTDSAGVKVLYVCQVIGTRSSLAKDFAAVCGYALQDTTSFMKTNLPHAPSSVNTSFLTYLPRPFAPRGT